VDFSTLRPKELDQSHSFSQISNITPVTNPGNSGSGPAPIAKAKAQQVSSNPSSDDEDFLPNFLSGIQPANNSNANTFDKSKGPGMTGSSLFGDSAPPTEAIPILPGPIYPNPEELNRKFFFWNKLLRIFEIEMPASNLSDFFN
jgi:hypothetical protein